MNLMELCVDAALTLPKVSVGVAINPRVLQRDMIRFFLGAI